MAKTRDGIPRGIRERHQRRCAAPTGRCTCLPSYQVRVWSEAEGRDCVRSFPTLGAAIAYQTDTKSAIKLGTLVTTRQTIREAGAALLDGMESGAIRNKQGKPFKASAVRSYRQGLGRVYPVLGHLDVRDVHRRDVQRLVDTLTATQAPRTVQNAIKPLRVLYRQALRDDQVTTSPLDGVTLPAPSQSEGRYVDDRETVNRMISVLTGQDCALWTVAFWSGLRIGELRALRWSDVDLRNAELHVRHTYDHTAHILTTPKSAKSIRTIPLTLNVVVALRGQRSDRVEPDGWVFPGVRGRPFSNGSASRKARDEWGRHEGLPTDVTWHTARHTYASLMIAAGTNFKTLSELMGHSSINVTIDLYGHLVKGAKRTAADQLTAYMTGA